MKDYIKPTFTLAGLFPVALAATCPVKMEREDVDTLLEQLGFDKALAFAETEACDSNNLVPLDIIGYCKFTSAGTTPGSTVLSS